PQPLTPRRDDPARSNASALQLVLHRRETYQLARRGTTAVSPARKPRLSATRPLPKDSQQSPNGASLEPPDLGNHAPASSPSSARVRPDSKENMATRKKQPPRPRRAESPRKPRARAAQGEARPPAEVPPEFWKRLDDEGVRWAKIGGFDIDGVLRGKYVSIDKLRSALAHGFGFCDVIFGWDMADVLYDASKVTGWHSGYP